MTLTLLMTCSHIQRVKKLKLVKLSFFSYDLDLDPMTLILKLDLDMIKIYLHTKNEVSMSSISRNTDRHTHTNRHTDRQTDMTENITYPHTRVVKKRKTSIVRVAVHQSVQSLNFCNIYFHRTVNRLCYDFVIVNTKNIPVSMSAMSPRECSLNDIIHLCRFARQSE